MTERKLPDIPLEALRDYSAEDSDERIEKGWRRLSDELEHTPTVERRVSLWWAPAAAIVLFGAGVAVGARWVGPSSPGVATTVAAERPVMVERPSGPEQAPTTEAVDPEVDEAKQAVPVVKAPLLAPSPVVEVPADVDNDPDKPAPKAAPVAPAWQTLLNAGNYQEAYAALQKAGGFSIALSQAAPGQLMDLADLARVNKQPAYAIAALKRLAYQHQGHADAATAAYMLGNMMRKAGNTAEAARAYAVYRSLSPTGDFVEDALARQTLAAISQKNLELARKLAAQYSKEFPSGDRSQEIQDGLAALEAEQPAAPDDDAGAGADGGVADPAE